MYFPRTQVEKAGTNVTFLVRSQLGAAGVLNSVKTAIASVSPGIDIQFEVLTDQIRESLTQDKLMATLCGFFWRAGRSARCNWTLRCDLLHHRATHQ